MIYPSLKEFIHLLEVEFNSLNNREQLVDILYSRTTKEEAIQSMIFGLLRRYRYYKNGHFDFQKECKDNKIICDFVIDDIVTKDYLKMQHFVQFRYVDGTNIKKQADELEYYMSKGTTNPLDNIISVVFHDLRTGTLSYEERQKILCSKLDGNKKLPVNDIQTLFLYDAEYNYKIDIYLKNGVYDVLQKEHCRITGELADDLIKKFDIYFLTNIDKEGYEAYLTITELLSYLDEFISEGGVIGSASGVNIYTENPFFQEVLKYNYSF